MGQRDSHHFSSPFQLVPACATYAFNSSTALRSVDVRNQRSVKRGIDPKIVEKATKKGYKISRVDRFRYRCRYFTDSGIIGGKDFVQEVFDQVKHLLGSKDTRKFTPVGGVEGLYSMKRLGNIN